MKFSKKIDRKPLLKGLLSGALLGIATYIVSMVIGVSFNSELKVEYILFDLLWQMAEQTVGGITAGIVYIWVYEGDPVEVMTRKMFGGN